VLPSVKREHLRGRTVVLLTGQVQADCKPKPLNQVLLLMLMLMLLLLLLDVAPLLDVAALLDVAPLLDLS